MTDFNLRLGQVIARLRQRQNLSQEDLAEAAGVHRTYVSQIERGIKSPTMKVFIRIAGALRTRPSAVLRMVEKEAREL